MGTEQQPEGAGAAPFLRAPNRGSLREKLYAYMREHPGELITRRNAQKVLNTKMKSVDRLLQELRDEGLLARINGHQLTVNAADLPLRSSCLKKPTAPRKSPLQPRPSPEPLIVPRAANSVFQLAEVM